MFECLTAFRNLFVRGQTFEGVIADFVIESGTSGDVFVAFVEQVLVPSLKAGSVVVIT